MHRPSLPLPPVLGSLSARLLVITIAAIMLGEVLIYLPSIARYRVVFLEERLGAARLAALAVEAAPEGMVSPALAHKLLDQAGVEAIVLHKPGLMSIMLGDEMPQSIDAVFDLRRARPVPLVGEAFGTLAAGGERLIRVIGMAPAPEEDVVVEAVMTERALFTGMVDYSKRILTLSIVLSLLSASLVFLALHRLTVRPMRQITASMVAFRKAPEEAASVIQPSRRSDEVGVAQRELAIMQSELREALRQKTRLAALGAAVSKINHDLRNILSSAVLVSDRIAKVADPKVREMTPQLLEVIDRAVALCGETLKFARAGEPAPRLSRFSLRPLADDVARSLPAVAEGRIRWDNRVPAELSIAADRDQLFRILLNLARNAADAMVRDARAEKRLAIEAEPNAATGGVAIEVADTGPGLPQDVLAHLFEPFTGAGRQGGTGLGLAIARDLVRAHGGAIELERTGPDGTVFRLDFPQGQGHAAVNHSG